MKNTKLERETLLLLHKRAVHMNERGNIKMNADIIKVLVIEDNPVDSKTIGRMLQQANRFIFEPVFTNNLLSGLEHLNTNKVHAVLLDLNLPDSRGVDSFLQLRHSFPNIPVIILSTVEEEETAASLIMEGAREYLIKSRVNAELLERTLGHAVEQKSPSLEVENTADIWQAVFDSLEDIIAVIGQDHKIVNANQSMARFCGMTIHELKGMYCYQAMYRKQNPCQNCPHEKSLQAGRSFCREEFDNVSNRCLEITASPVFNQKGEATHSVHIMRDITGKKSLESAGIRKEKMQKLLNITLSTCHELNQPLQVILGYSSLLSKRNQSQKAPQKWIVRVRDQVNKMAEIARKLNNITTYEVHRILREDSLSKISHRYQRMRDE